MDRDQDDETPTLPTLPDLSVNLLIGRAAARAALLRDVHLDVDWNPYTHRYTLVRAVPTEAPR